MQSAHRRREFFNQYVATALWCETDDNDTQLERNYAPSDLAPCAREKMQADCDKFLDINHALLDGLSLAQLTQAAHDFWLTRNGHGAGFWDGDWAEPMASIFTSSSKQFGECNLYVGDDNKIYVG